MTHDKAVELARHAMINSKSRAHGLVDALIVLGLLNHVTAGEGGDSIDKRMQKFWYQGVPTQFETLAAFKTALDQIGLKLVLK